MSSYKVHHNLEKNKLEKIKVLVVEDDNTIVTLLKDVLMVFGFKRVVFTKDGSEALRRMNDEVFDFIITDWETAPMSGIDFVKYLRTNAKSPDFFVPIIMLTGRAEKENIEVARDTGITEFIAKPFSVEKLRERIIFIFENPREFVFADEYSGPSRRRKDEQLPKGVSEDRRKRD